MAGSYLNDKSVIPDNTILADTLGRTYKFWEEIKTSLENKHVQMVEEWKHYGKTIGWLLKLLHKKRNLFFLVPCEKYFYLSFVFGDKAMAVVEQSDIPQHMIDELKNAKKYAEGRGLRVEVKEKRDIKNILKLVEIKIKN